MPSMFSSIQNAVQAMLVQQQAMDVVQDNVANANTPGYHRQEAVLGAGLPTTFAGFQNAGFNGKLGGGVQVEQIKRYTSEFLNKQYRSQLAESARWQLASEQAGQLETILGDTTTNGLLPLMDQFWSSWQQLSADPTNPSLRANVLQSGKDLATAFNQRSSQLLTTQFDQNRSLDAAVHEINSLAQQVADLNGKIIASQGMGLQPNDLLDQRDQMLDRLAELSGATYRIQENGEALVFIQGHSLVTAGKADSLSFDAQNLTGQILWENGETLVPQTGQLRGLLDVRDQLIPELKQGLDSLAYGLSTAVNGAHNPDADPTLNFFNPLAASTDAAALLTVAPGMEDLSKILGASSSNPGDGGIALQIANLADQPFDASGETPHDFYTQQITGLGLFVQNATAKGQASGALTANIGDQRDSLTGVSLDEEAARLIQYQRGYEAAARLVTAMDEMLDKVINGMGVAGR